MAWTEITHPKYPRDGLRYSIDTTNAECALIVSILPPPASCGRPWEVELRDLVDAVFHVAQSGCQCRPLLKDFPPYSTVQRYFYTWRDNRVWQTVHHVLLMEVRDGPGREASPSADVIDRRQSVKRTKSGEPSGYAAEKMIKGRMHPILTDTIGLPVGMIVHAADDKVRDGQDRDGAVALLARVCEAFPCLRHAFADGGYAGDNLKDATKDFRNWTSEILKRSDAIKGLVLLHQRWIEERTVAWLARNRRLAKDFEATVKSMVTWLYIASVKLMSHRLAAA